MCLIGVIFNMGVINTYSIVAYDPSSKEWGVAVQSKYFAVSTIVSWARANAGALATQASGDPTHWNIAKPLLSRGVEASQVMEEILKKDKKSNFRQIGLIDRAGNSAAYTGGNCIKFAGHSNGFGYSIQGNFLLPNTIQAIEHEYKKCRSLKMSLCDCLMNSLKSGQNHGGDKRGVQAAGILVVKEDFGYNSSNDRYIDLRVDDHLNPIDKLENLLNIHKIMYGIDSSDHLTDINSEKNHLVKLLRLYGYKNGSDFEFYKNLKHFTTNYNLNKSILDKDNKIDIRILKTFEDRLKI
ncbi:DUF1028 domain-containing protein [Cyclobacterium plantarum]|uniref:DUF1028 domain-containing protein n=1 Tax=Cyclobacterium plantarum TaxID=2716263 RepID=UPI003F725A93